MSGAVVGGAVVGGGTAAVLDPELPMLTLDDLEVIRSVAEDGDSVTVTITPTYSGCPALEAMRDDIQARLADAGYTRITVRTVLAPAWSTDWISDRGQARTRRSRYRAARPSGCR